MTSVANVNEHHHRKSTVANVTAQRLRDNSKLHELKESKLEHERVKQIEKKLGAINKKKREVVKLEKELFECEIETLEWSKQCQESDEKLTSLEGRIAYVRSHIDSNQKAIAAAQRLENIGNKFNSSNTHAAIVTLDSTADGHTPAHRSQISATAEEYDRYYDIIEQTFKTSVGRLASHQADESIQVFLVPKTVQATMRESKALQGLREPNSLQRCPINVNFSENEGYSMSMLLDDACKYFELHAELMYITDEAGAVWPMDLEVEKYSEELRESGVWLKYKAWAYRDDSLAFGFAEAKQLETLKALLSGAGGTLAEGVDDSILSPTFRKNIQELKKKKDREAKAKERGALQRELYQFMLFLFLLIFSLYSSGVDTNSAFYVKKALQSAFLGGSFGTFGEYGFLDITAISSYYDWLELPFLQSTLQIGDVTDTSYNEQAEYANIFLYNKIVGPIRFRQVRVEPDSCTLNERIKQVREVNGTKEYRWYVDGCYSSYSGSSASTALFGPAEDGFEWKSEADLQMTGVSGGTGNYDGSGYHKDVVCNYTALTHTIQQFKKHHWLDKQTRAVSININIYNGNLNVYTAVQFLLEIGESGAVSTSADFKVFQLVLLSSGSSEDANTGLLLANFILYLYIAYYALNELSQMCIVTYRKSSPLPYFTEVWNLVDVATVCCFVYASSLQATLLADPQVLGWSIFQEEYSHLYRLAQMNTQLSIVLAFNVAISLFKFFKFYHLNESMFKMWKTLYYSLKDAMYFTLVMIIFLTAFVVMANQMFGSLMYEFRNPTAAFATCLLITLGSVPFYEMKAAQPLYGPVFVIVYIVFVFFILLNIYLAIIGDAYVKVQEEDEGEQSKTSTMAVIKAAVAVLRQKKKELYLNGRLKQALAKEKGKKMQEQRVLKRKEKLVKKKEAKMQRREEKMRKRDEKLKKTLK